MYWPKCFLGTRRKLVHFCLKRFMLKAVVTLIAAHYESLQDKLAQLKDAREALDALREDHREKRRREMEELERQRQIQMAHKLEIMRQKKHVCVTLITHLSGMDFPIPIHLTSHFQFEGCWVLFFIFIQILIEFSGSKQSRPWSDAAFGFALFAYVQQKGH